jgi:hypothetical protein
MKKLLWLGVLLSLLFSSHTFAAGTLSVKATGTNINATLSGVKGNPDTFRLVILKSEFPSGATPSQSYTNSAIQFTDASIMEHKASTEGVVNWELTGYTDIKAGTTYYARIVEIDKDNKLTYATSTSTVKTAGANTTPNLMSLSVAGSGTSISATLVNLTALDATYKLVVRTTPFTQEAYNADPKVSIDGISEKSPTVTGGSVTGTVTLAATNLLPNTTYYIKAIEIPKNPTTKPFYITETNTYKTGEDSIPLFPLTTKLDGHNIIVTGKIDTSKLTSTFVPSDYTVTLSATKTAPLAGATVLISPEIGPLTSRQSYLSACDTSKSTCINKNGEYAWYLTNLSPSTVYYFQQTITVKGNKVPIRDTINHFNSSVGTTISPGSAAEKADLNKRSYTLLTPFPNFSVLPDPDLCAEQRAQGLNPKFCDMNDVINYALKLLIGLSAVVLVFRLMFEGYTYMVSDVPFLKANAKGAFYTALGGLLLALTSYIILNTINPKLVDGTINVNQLAIGVEIVGDGNTTFTPGTKTKGLPTPVYCPGSGGRGQLSKIATSFQNNVVYNQTLRNSLQTNGKIALDCSSYVAQVLSCAGYNISGVSTGNTNTGTIFGSAKAEKITSITSANGVVTVNNKALEVGDLLGWTGSKGHVVMYIGSGQIVEVHGPTGSLTNAKVWPSIDWYQSHYGFKSVYRVPNQ